MANKLIQDLTAGAFALTDLLEHQPIAGPPSLKGDVAALVTLLNTIYAPITGGAYVLKAGDTMTGLLTIAQATANTSNLILSGQSLTGANAQSLLSMAGTWNTSGTPTGIRLVITDTASNAASLLMDLRVGALSLFSVDKIGATSAGAFAQMGSGGTFAYLYARAASNGLWLGTGASVLGYTGIRNPAGSQDYFACSLESGIIWTSGAANFYNTTIDTGLTRNAAGILEVNNGTPGTFRDIKCRTVFSNNAVSLVSTNTTLTDFAAAALGTLTNAPTAGNPAKWIAIVDNGTTRYIPTWV